jgi:phosphate transport system substrate-binding protein
MMQKKLFSFTLVLLVAGMLLSACSPAAATTAPTAEQVQPAAASTTAPVAATAAPTSLPAGSITINGAGATFPQPIYAQWTYAYQYVDPSVVMNYQGIGSGGGKNAIIAGTVDFAGSDSLLSAQNYTDGKDLQMLPMVAGAVVPVYNIKFNTVTVSANTPTPAAPAKLILDRETLVGIFNSTITKWNDPAIVALNPDLKDLLPDANITVVHRSDGSGTTELFTKALASFSTNWKAGGAQSVEWPVDKAGNGMGGKGNPGVAAAVLNTPNSIGYVELSYALSNSMSFANMVNKAGKVVTANAASLASAISDFGDKFDEKMNLTIVDAPGDGSWPISGYTYLIVHTTNMTDCVKAQKLLEYIKWTLTDPSAAKQASTLGYAVLPGAVQQAVLAKLTTVTCSGNPVLK